MIRFMLKRGACCSLTLLLTLLCDMAYDGEMETLPAGKLPMGSTHGQPAEAPLGIAALLF